MTAATRVIWLATPASTALLDPPAGPSAAAAGPTGVAPLVADPSDGPPPVDASTAAEGDAPAPAAPRPARADTQAALATIGGAVARVGDRSGTLVDGSTTVLCMTSVMSTSLADASTRAGAVAAHAAEIAGRSREAAEATGEIRALVEGALETVQALGQHARDIERISGTLSRLALETRFVGINAAIEAARAGAAGSGFSVVADKVRELADGAGAASEQIIERLRTIRDSAVRSAGVMEQVGARIGTIDVHTTTIAGAAAEQESGASEIAAGIAQIAASVDDVVRAVEDMTEIGMAIGDDAGQVRAAVDTLRGDAEGAA